MARDPYNVFRMQQQFFSYFKRSHAYCFCVDFPGSLQHFEICLKLLTHKKKIFSTEGTRQK